MSTAHLRGLLRDLDPARLRGDAAADAGPAAAAQADLRAGTLTALRADGDRHLTVSCLLVAGEARDRSVALGLHAKSGQWRQLGGHLESDDASLRSAAVRELREESGIAACGGLDSVGRFEGVAGTGAVLLPTPVAVREFLVGTPTCAAHVDVLFAARARSRAALHTTDDGIERVQWWPATALPAGIAPDLRRDLPHLLTRIEHAQRPDLQT